MMKQSKKAILIALVSTLCFNSSFVMTGCGNEKRNEAKESTVKEEMTVEDKKKPDVTVLSKNEDKDDAVEENKELTENEDLTENKEAKDKKEETKPASSKPQKPNASKPSQKPEEKPSKPSEKPSKPEEKPNKPAEKPEEKPEEKPNHTHSYKETVVKATCTKNGYTKYTCECGHSYKDNVKEALGHRFGAWKTVKEPTIFTKGRAERTCTRCDHVESKEIPKKVIGHTHSYKSTITTKPTCTKEGVRTFKCECGASYTEKIPMSAHRYTDNVVNPTCSAEGYTQHTCSCGKTYKDTYVAKLPHNLQDSVVNPTCEKGGYTQHTCANCGYSYQDTHTNPTGHDYKEIGNSATCTAGGKITEQCTKCGKQIAQKDSPALGHDEKVERKEPTCTEEGYEKKYCARCSTVISNNTIAPNGQHNWYRVNNIDAYAKQMIDKGELSSYWGQFLGANETSMLVCSSCGDVQHGSSQHIYEGNAGATTMLSWVNNLRTSVYGTSEYNLQIDSTLNNLAYIRAKEYMISHSHYGGTFTNAAENASSYYRLRDHFNGWSNSPKHRQNMLAQDAKYFGFGLVGSRIQGSDAIQLFWTEDNRDMYFA